MKYNKNRIILLLLSGSLLTGCNLGAASKKPVMRADEFLKTKAALATAAKDHTEEVIQISKNLSPENKAALSLVGMDREKIKPAIKLIEKNWNSLYLKRLIELTYFVDLKTKADLVSLLEKKTGKKYGEDQDSWYRYLWKQKDDVEDSSYANFKALLYSRVDPRFIEYFHNSPKHKIRLDEIRWGGVLRDGIPPLRNPKMISASEATYLGDNNVVFGIEVNGDKRAYPKRILAWHELFTDEVGGVPVAGVYCTLCGSMIPYKSSVNKQKFLLGTSGFLYRSNKLMYDAETKSMWSTLRGVPVVGELVDKNLKLKVLPVVTTTWGQWKKLNPESKVLSLDTGYYRDYGEGVAYKNYFSSDLPMFTIAKLDRRLKNKAEVLVPRWGSDKIKPLAFDKAFLKKNMIHFGTFRDKDYVVLTDKSGASRIYEADKKLKLVKFQDSNSVLDKKGKSWKITENGLLDDSSTKVYKRLPAHKAFWFGWYAAHPDTTLIM